MVTKIVFEDDGLLIVDKPQGLATAPGEKNDLCALIFSQRPELKIVHGYREGEGGLLNRLDNETGGLVLFAKTDEAFNYYAARMKENRIVKTYLAVVVGTPGTQSGEIDLPIAHSLKSGKRMVIADEKRNFRGNALPAVTKWRLLDSQPPLSLLSVAITKGVRHQIRLHLASAGLPIVGDKLYNKKEGAGKTLATEDANGISVTHHFLYCTKVEFRSLRGEETGVETAAPFRDGWKELSQY
jgi:RluA family pseudouridine synthase